PIITRRHRVADGPNRGHIGHLHGKTLVPQALVQSLRPLVPTSVEIAVKLAHLAGIEKLQELVHRTHNDGMRIECSTGEPGVARPIVAKPLHQVLAAAEDANRKPSADRFSISNKVGPDTEIFLRPARSEAKADKYLVKDQHDVLLGAHFPQSLEPVSIGLFVESNPSSGAYHRRVGRRGCVRVQCLQGIYKDASNIATCAEHSERRLRNVPERVGFPRLRRISDARLHIAPPPMISPAEAYQVRAPGVI